jgi:hypothetical protein
MNKLTRREREKELARRQAALAWADKYDREQRGNQPDEDHIEEDPARQRPSRPRRYGIPTLAELAAKQPIHEVYLYCRDSSGRQNLYRQIRGACRRIRKLGIKVRYVYREIGDGKSLKSSERAELHKAIQRARERGIPLVLVCISRGVRNRCYHPYFSPKLKPTQQEFEEFLELAGGVQIATLNDPDSDPPADEAFIRQLHAEVKRRKPGRPGRKPAGYTKQQMANWPHELVEEMRSQGMGWRTIAYELYLLEGISVSHMTVRKRYLEAAKGAV